uniref:Ovule protein n=1 Tax=Strongyloides venezuelensis TaxID=75913 RepID=A0A0K0FRX8_STRVS
MGIIPPLLGTKQLQTENFASRTLPGSNRSSTKTLDLDFFKILQLWASFYHIQYQTRLQKSYSPLCY